MGAETPNTEARLLAMLENIRTATAKDIEALLAQRPDRSQ